MAKKPQRTYKGDTKPVLIEQAITALTPADEERDGPTPTSVELLDDYARVWFEVFAEEDYDVVGDWSYSMAVPLYHFWGRKKREKYLKEQRKIRDD